VRTRNKVIRSDSIFQRKPGFRYDLALQWQRRCLRERSPEQRQRWWAEVWLELGEWHGSTVFLRVPWRLVRRADRLPELIREMNDASANSVPGNGEPTIWYRNERSPDFPVGLWLDHRFVRTPADRAKWEARARDVLGIPRSVRSFSNRGRTEAYNAAWERYAKTLPPLPAGPLEIVW